MAALALAQVTVYLLAVFPLRALLRRRRFGSAGRADFGASRPWRWWVADLSFLAGFALVVAGPLLDLAGVLGDADAPTGLVVAGVALAVAALALALWTQRVMGEAWRPDIAPAAGAALATGGPLGVVRNPSYVAMVGVAAATVLVAPDAVSAAGTVLLTGSVALTARLEEAELLGTHGAPYAAYLARVGRFVPGVGRIRS